MDPVSQPEDARHEDDRHQPAILQKLLFCLKELFGRMCLANGVFDLRGCAYLLRDVAQRGRRICRSQRYAHKYKIGIALLRGLRLQSRFAIDLDVDSSIARIHCYPLRHRFCG